MPDTIPNTPTATAPAAAPAAPTTPAPAPEAAPAVTNGQAPKSFRESLTQTMTDQGLDFGMDDFGRVTIEPLAKPETVDGHSVEELEKIAQGEQPPTQPIAQPLSQQPTQPAQAQSQPSSDVAALQQRVALLTDYILSQQGQQGQNGNGNAPPAAPAPAPSMRDTLAKELEEADGDPERQADIFMRAMDQREQQLRGQIAQDYNLPQMSLQSDLVRLYNQHGEDFKASLPAIELFRQGDPTIPLEQAYEGVRLLKQALGITGAPQQGAPTNGTAPTATPSQPRVLTQEEAQALLAKAALMKTQSGVNGTEAKPSNAKKSFGEMLHQGLADARRQGRAGG